LLNFSSLWNKKIEYTLFTHLSKKRFEYAEEIYDSWALFIPERGMFQYETEGLSKDTLSPGEILLCPPGVRFRKKVIAPVSLYIMHFTIFPTEDIHPIKGNLLYQKIKIQDEKRLFSTLAYLKNYYFRQGIEEEYLKHLLRDVWYLICLRLNNLTEEEPLYAENPEMRSIYEYICLHLSEKIDIGEIAEAFGFSNVNFIRRFKKLFSTTPVTFITTLRLQKAKKMLVETTLSVSKIAKACGFENPYYFSNVFTKYLKICPTRYREMAMRDT